ncbi:MAG: sortase [Eubacterium sp.]|nr:sortase [Eubacterium sp.]
MSFNQDEIDELLAKYSSYQPNSGEKKSSDEKKSSNEKKSSDDIKAEDKKFEEKVSEAEASKKAEPVKEKSSKEKIIERQAQKEKLSLSGNSSGDKYKVGKSEDDVERVLSRAEIIKNQKKDPDLKKKAEARLKKKKRANAILNALLVFFILVFLGSGAYLGIYFYKIHKAQSGFDDLKSLIRDSSKDKGDEGESTVDPDMVVPKYVNIDGVSVQEKFADLYTRNHEFVGWLTVDGTNIDYPVMHTPDDEEKYLRRDFDGNSSSSGTLFVAAASDPIAPSDNVIIYGHNMKAGTMFHSLLNFEKKEYYEEHKLIEFDTIEEDAQYEVIAAFRTKIDESDPNLYKYYEFHNASSEEEFNEYVSKVKSMTPYEIEATAKYGDKLITLSTCAYHAEEGRYVIVAKKL